MNGFTEAQDSIYGIVTRAGYTGTEEQLLIQCKIKMFLMLCIELFREQVLLLTKEILFTWLA